MRTFAASIFVTVAVLAVGGQLALPAYLEGRVRDRLEQGGGTATVSLRAFPAWTLIAGRGKRFDAEGSGLTIDLDKRREQPFERLDGFEQVDIHISDLNAGPLDVNRFELTRRGRDDAYHLSMRATSTPRELARELGSEAGGALGGLLGSLATGVLPEAGRTEVPVRVDAEVDSDDGRPNVRDASGSVAGIPAGPLTEVVLGAVLKRL